MVTTRRLGVLRIGRVSVTTRSCPLGPTGAYWGLLMPTGAYCDLSKYMVTYFLACYLPSTA
jgi:hypothetical protein